MFGQIGHFSLAGWLCTQLTLKESTGSTLHICQFSRFCNRITSLHMCTSRQHFAQHTYTHTHLLLACLFSFSFSRSPFGLFAHHSTLTRSTIWVSGTLHTDIWDSHRIMLCNMYSLVYSHTDNKPGNCHSNVCRTVILTNAHKDQ